MKSIFKLLVLLFALGLVILYNEKISKFVLESFIIPKKIHLEEPNDYALNYNFKYIKPTDDFFAYDKNDLLSIIYTALNNGYDNFYFICNYDECEDDVSNLKNTEEFIDINNFVHPYNSYNHLHISINAFRKVSIIVDKNYDREEINIVNQKIDEIINKIITSNMTDKEKIKAFHNYIINNTSYDIEYVENKLNDPYNPSHKATGPLVYKKALCGGYTDVTSIFLNKLKIPNYRIASDTHIWNLVKINNNWYHLDLTWDDPTNQEMLIDAFFLINTKTLENFKTGHHNFNKNKYLEAN